MTIKDWDIEAETGYKPKTTFYTDFSIAENSGVAAVKDTYNRAFSEWKDNVEYLTELVMVINWKAWEHYITNESLCDVYIELFDKSDSYAIENLKGDDLEYYYRTTD